MLLRSFSSELTRTVRRQHLARASAAAYSSSITRLDGKKSITINWKNRDGSVVSTPAEVGSNLLRVAHKNSVELEGACEGVCACSTCHIILDQGVYDELPEASEDEEDMLDQAPGLTSTSRLGCQVCIEEKHDGMTVRIPAATRNFYVDGHKPKPH